jgi:hypothetical protein
MEKRKINKHVISVLSVLFIPGLNIYAAGFLSGMIGIKGDLKQGILGALTAGFPYRSCVLGPSHQCAHDL